MGVEVVCEFCLEVGDCVCNDFINLYDFLGVYFFLFDVVGILELMCSVDDDVVFIGFKMVWMFDGCMYGYDVVCFEDMIVEEDGIFEVSVVFFFFVEFNV